jgi:hypothetical protein
MAKSVTKLSDIQLQLEEAVQMLRLVAKNYRTSVEVQEWLDINHPEHSEEDGLTEFLKMSPSVNLI